MRTKPTVRRQAVVVVALLLIVGVAAAGWFAGTRVQSPETAASRAAPPEPSLVTAPVERRVLSTRVVDRGDVVPGASTSVSGPTSESALLVTGVFVEVGDQLTDGSRIVEVSGRPVFVFEGEIPAFRAMRPGMQGVDIDQLQAALGRLGCDTGPDDGVFGSITKRCVTGLYEQLGYPTEPTSDDEAEQLADASDAVAEATDQLATAQRALDEAAAAPKQSEVAQAEINVAAAQRKVAAEQSAAGAKGIENAAAIDAAVIAANAELADRTSTPAERRKALADVDAAVRTARADAATAAEAVTAAEEALRLAEAELADLTSEPDVDTEQAAVDQATESLERADAALDELVARTGPTVPLGELVFVETLPATVSTLSARVGVPVGTPTDDQGFGSSPTALAVLATAALRVEVFVSPSDIEHLEPGMDVTVTDDVSGEELTGVLASLSDQMETSLQGDDRGFLAVVEADDIPRQWTGRNVRVTFTGARTAGEVLVVPLPAIWAAAGGATNVQVEQDDGTVRTVPVEVGLEADGFVEVTPLDGGDLAAGDQVVVGRQ